MPQSTGKLLLVDGVSYLLLANGVDHLLLSGGGTIVPTPTAAGRIITLAAEDRGIVVEAE